MSATEGKPISAGNLAAAIGEAVSGTVLYDSASPSEHQIALSEDLGGFDYVEVCWHYSHSGDWGDGCERFACPLENGTCFAHSVNTGGPRYLPRTGIINVSGSTLTLTSTSATGDVEGNYLKFRRVVGYRAGGGSS